MAILRVHIVPNAKVDSIAGEYGDAVKIKLCAPAVEGKANAALVRFLADAIGGPPSCHCAAKRSAIARQTDSNKWVNGGRGAQAITNRAPKVIHDRASASPASRSS